jgi:SAM-dependent methyltransferase
VTEPTATGRDPWEVHAQWWQDGFTEGADAEYEEQILPIVEGYLRGYGRVLDVGTGEGQIARRLARAGAGPLIGVDPTVAQLRVAAARGGDVRYARGRAEALPVATASVDAVVACLVFEHLPDHTVPLGEVARVLRPGGRFVWCLNHPLLQTPNSGWIDDQVLEEQYWRIGPYLDDDVSLEELEPGVVLPFVHRPLGRYVNTMIESGLALTRMDEPAPPPGFLARADEYAAAASIPRLLVLVAERNG